MIRPAGRQKTPLLGSHKDPPEEEPPKAARGDAGRSTEETPNEKPDETPQDEKLRSRCYDEESETGA